MILNQAQTDQQKNLTHSNIVKFSDIEKKSLEDFIVQKKVQVKKLVFTKDEKNIYYDALRYRTAIKLFEDIENTLTNDIMIYSGDIDIIMYFLLQEKDLTNKITISFLNKIIEYEKRKLQYSYEELEAPVLNPKNDNKVDTSYWLNKHKNCIKNLNRIIKNMNEYNNQIDWKKTAENIFNYYNQ